MRRDPTLVRFFDYLFPDRALERSGGMDNPFLLDRARRRRGFRLPMQFGFEAVALALAFVLSGRPLIPVNLSIPLFVLLLQRYYLFVNNPMAQTRLLAREYIESIYLTPLGPREFFVEPFLACRFPRRFLVALFVVAIGRDGWVVAANLGTPGYVPALPGLSCVLAAVLLTSLAGPTQYAMEWRLFVVKPRLVTHRVFSWAASFFFAGLCTGAVFKLLGDTPFEFLLCLAGLYLGGAWLLCQFATVTAGEGIGFLWRPFLSADADWRAQMGSVDWPLSRALGRLLFPFWRGARGKSRGAGRPVPSDSARDGDDPASTPPVSARWLWTGGIVFGLVFCFVFSTTYQWFMHAITFRDESQAIPVDLSTILHLFLIGAVLFPIPMTAPLAFFRIHEWIRNRRPLSLASLISEKGGVAAAVCIVVALVQTGIDWAGGASTGPWTSNSRFIPVVLVMYYLRFQMLWWLILAVGIHSRLFAGFSGSRVRFIAILIGQAVGLGVILTLTWNALLWALLGSVDGLTEHVAILGRLRSFGGFVYNQAVLDWLYLSATLLSLAAVKGRFSRMNARLTSEPVTR